MRMRNKNIKIFGALSEILENEITLDLPNEINRQIILSNLTEKFPLQASEIEKCNVAVNQTYVFDEVVKNDENTEIAIIPPVSGG